MAEPILKEGAVALVTGASSGIGRALLPMLAEAGARVIGTGRNRARLEEAMAPLGERGLPVVLDVTDGPAVATFLDRLPEDWRRVDILVNNAGQDIGGRAPFESGTADQWAGTIEANVTGLIRMSHAVLPGMLERNRGDVINIGSVSGVRTYKHGNVYIASKAAVHALTDALRLDYGDTHLRITEILPGLVKTGFATARAGGDEAQGEAFYAGFPAYMEPEDVARTVVFALQQPPHVTIAQLMVVPTRV